MSVRYHRVSTMRTAERVPGVSVFGRVRREIRVYGLGGCRLRAGGGLHVVVLVAPLVELVTEFRERRTDCVEERFGGLLGLVLYFWILDDVADRGESGLDALPERCDGFLDFLVRDGL